MAIRPKNLNEYVGQEHAKAQLNIAIQAALKENRPLPHILFYGSRGLGKTTLAQVVANEMNSKLISVLGLNIQNNSDVLNLCKELDWETPNIIFIDEIHNLPRTVEEHFYPILEDGIIEFEREYYLRGKFVRKEKTKAQVAPFTMIGATTSPGMLSAPLKDRFGLIIELKDYSENDLTKITENYCEKRGIPINSECALAIAQRARGRARYLINLIERCRDYYICQEKDQIDEEVIKHIFALMCIDEIGLTETDYRVLKLLYSQERAGAKAIASSLEIDLNELESFVEPFLIKQGFIQKTSRGRILTNHGKVYLENQLIQY